MQRFEVAVFTLFSILASIPRISSALDLAVSVPPGPIICHNAVLLYPEMLSEISKRVESSYCFDAKFIHVTSKKCFEECDLVKSAETYTKPLEYSTKGSPGSWFCKALGGQSRIMFIEYQSIRHKQSLCLLGDDLASNPYLLSLKGRRILQEDKP